MLALLLVAPGQGVPAGEARLPVVSGQVIRDYARIQFEWPVPVYISASANGNIITVTFDRRADPDFGMMLRQLRPYVTSASVINGGKGMRLTMNRAYRIRSFVSGNVSGLDILGIRAGVDTREANVNGRRSTAQVAGLDKPGKNTMSAARVASLAPAAGGKQEAKKATAEKLAETKAETPAEAKQAKEPEPLSDAEAAALQASTRLTATEGGEQGGTDAAPGPAATKAESADTNTKASFKPAAARSGSVFEAVFPWKQRVAAATFMRGGYQWVVFSKAAAVDVSEINAQLAPRQAEAAQLSAGDSTVLRIPLENYQGAELHKEAGTFAWKLTLFGEKRVSDKPLEVQVNTETSQGYVFIPALEAADAVTVSDPDIGDELLVVPLYGDNQNIAPARGFVDFTLMESTQGVVVQKKSDDVRVMMARNGIRISTEKGATLSPDLSATQKKPSPATQQKGETLFPYEEWKPAESTPLYKQVQQFRQEIAAAPTSAERSEKMQMMAQFYLGQGETPEALGILNEIKRADPKFYETQRLSALSGAADFLLYRFGDAAENFNALELNDLPEIAYWRAMLSELLGDSEQKFDYMANNDKYFSKYPPLMRQRLAVFAADRAVANKQYNMALAIFDQLNKDGLINDIADYVNYLMGKISVETGKQKEGMELWQKLADTLRDSSVRARAEYSLIATELKQNSITKDQAIDRLERLALMWRGDSLELNTLNMLGELYRDRKDWPNAMRVWAAMNSGFPNTELATEAGRKMTEAFVALFDGDDKAGMTSLERLFLYNQFHYLTPTDDVGDRIVERMTDEMVALDLLDQASNNLEQRMQFKFEREERSRVGAKLAHIYLMNHQPDKAMRALQNSVYGSNSPALNEERTYLTIRALAGQKEYESALRMLENDKTPEGQAIRLDIYWQQKDWPKVALLIEGALKARANPAAPLSTEETRMVVQLALAYVAQSDMAQVRYLRDYFMPIMEGNPDKSVFEFVTRNDAPLNVANFDAVMQNLSDVRQQLTGYTPKAM